MKIALYPGSFSPGHIGHFNVVQKLCSEMDKVLVIKSNKPRDGISVEQSINIWNLYLKLLPDNVEIKISDEVSPITECFQIIKNDGKNDFYIVFGKNEDRHVQSFIKLNLKNVHIYNAGNYGNISATNFRQAIKNRNMTVIKSFLPPGVNDVEFMEKMGLNLHEIKIVPNSPIKVGDTYRFDHGDLKVIITFISYKTNEIKFKLEFPDGEIGEESEAYPIEDLMNDLKTAKKINEIKIVPNQINLDLGEGNEYEGKDKDGHRVTIIIQRYKRPGQIRDYEITYTISSWNPSYGHNTTKSEYSTIEDLRKYIISNRLKLKYTHPKDIDEIKILPNNFRYPKIGDNYKLIFSGPHDGLIINIIDINKDKNIISYKHENNPKLHTIAYDTFIDEIEKKHVQLVKINEELFSKDWWSKNLLQEDVDEIKIVPNRREPRIGDIIEWIGYPGEKYKIISKEGNNYKLLKLFLSINKYHKIGEDTLFLGLKEKFIKIVGHEDNLNENQEQTTKLTDEQKQTIKQFIGYAFKELNITKSLNGLKLSYDNNAVKERASFAYYDPNSNKIWVYVKNRNMADILRSIAHELVHSRQNEEGRLKQDSGNTGSEIENEANSKAGVMLRDFGKDNKGIYEIKIQPNYRRFQVGDIIDLTEWEDITEYHRVIAEIINIEKDDFVLEDIDNSSNYFFIETKRLEDAVRHKQIKYLRHKNIEEIKIIPNIKIKPKLGQIWELTSSYPNENMRGLYRIISLDSMIILLGTDSDNLFQKHSFNLKQFVDEVRMGWIKLFSEDNDFLDEIKIQPNTRIKAGIFVPKDRDENEPYIKCEISKVDYKNNQIYYEFTQNGFESAENIHKGQTTPEALIQWLEINNYIKLNKDNIQEKINEFQQGIEEIVDEIKIIPNNQRMPRVGDIYEFLPSSTWDGQYKITEIAPSERRNECTFVEVLATDTIYRARLYYNLSTVIYMIKEKQIKFIKNEKI